MNVTLGASINEDVRYLCIDSDGEQLSNGVLDIESDGVDIIGVDIVTPVVCVKSHKKRMTFPSV